MEKQGNQHAFRPAGDLVFVIQSLPHPRFRREGHCDLMYETSVSLLDALVGFRRKLTLLTGKRLTVRDRMTHWLERV